MSAEEEIFTLREDVQALVLERDGMRIELNFYENFFEQRPDMLAELKRAQRTEEIERFRRGK